MSATVSKFGAALLKAAKERALTPEGKEEMKDFSLDEFLVVVEKFAEAIDSLPDSFDVKSVYLGMNYVGSALVQTMEQQLKELMRQTGGSA